MNNLTINVNLKDDDKGSRTKGSEIIEDSKEILTKEAIERELEAGRLVNLNDKDGGVIHARLICTPAGSGVYYSDTRNAEGRLEIGAEIKNYVS